MRDVVNMIEIPSKGVYKIGGYGKEIKVIYKTEKDAMDARMEMHKKSGEELNKMFPEGMF